MNNPDTIFFDVDPATPEPYRGYIKERNGRVAQHLGALLGASTVAELSEPSVSDRTFHVPSRTLTVAEGDTRGIETVDDLYGGVIGANDIAASKLALHQVVGKAPEGYSRVVADQLRAADVTLPGFAAFNNEAAELAFLRLRSDGHRVRIKDPRQSDFEGQTEINSVAELNTYLGGIPKINEHGIVLEANLQSPATTSVGSVVLDGQTNSFFGCQKTVFHGGKDRFGGGALTFFQGDLLDLHERTASAELKHAIMQAHLAQAIFGQYDPILSRFSFDVLQGLDNTGNKLSGISDQTFRVGGLTPAEVLAVEAFKTQTATDMNVGAVHASVSLIYNPTQEERALNGDAVAFIDRPDLMVVAKVDSISAKPQLVRLPDDYPAPFDAF